MRMMRRGGPVEGRLGLGQRGLKQAEITDAAGATGLGQHPPVGVA